MAVRTSASILLVALLLELYRFGSRLKDFSPLLAFATARQMMVEPLKLIVLLEVSGPKGLWFHVLVLAFAP